jgi:ABC-type dipeptide/oligopeptide/nickel transport system permease subunit
MARRTPSLLGKVWSRLARNKIALFAIVMIVLELVIAVVAPYITPHDPMKTFVGPNYASPSREFPFGTDDLGRDMLSRMILGTRVSMMVGIFSQLAIVLIGIPLGAVSGLLGGWVDYVIMRVIDVLSSVPAMLFYLLLMIALGRGTFNLILAMAITGWIGIARLVRGQVLSLKATDYVRASTAMGANTTWIISRHLIRNAISPVIVTVTLGVPGAIFAEAGLSLLGLGTPPITPSWGNMIGAGGQVFRTHAYLILIPSMALTFTILFWMILGDALQKAMDPTGS